MRARCGEFGRRYPDTTACVAGGLAGILYGREAIPSEWLATLRGKDVIEACLFEERALRH